MLKKLNKNSNIIFIGILFVVSGIILGTYDYFLQKKNETFSEMNVKLFKNEIPEVIDSEKEYQEKINNNNIETPKDENPKEETPTTPNKTENNYSNYLGVLEIPKINIKRGFYSVDSKYNNVDYNVTVIQNSTLPDVNNNNLILAAHSGDCSVCYFHNLYKISTGDEAYIYYKSIKYKYKVVNIYEVEKTGRVAIYRDFNKNTLTLITCTRNSNTKQTVYILELVSEEKY